MVMTIIWAANYSVIKAAFSDIQPVAFNAVRLLLASALFLAAIAWKRVRLSHYSCQNTNSPVS